MTPFLSILVPVYNVEKYISQCIDSILSQKFTDFECILVDDGSTDLSGQICDDYSKKDERIVVVHKENGGLITARQEGLKLAKGKYVGYVDSDDFIHPNMYLHMCEMAEKYGCDIVECDYQDYREGDSLDQKKAKLHWDGLFDGDRLHKEVMPRVLYYGCFFRFGVAPAVWQKIFRRELVLKHQLEVDDRISLGEDAACSYYCYLDAQSVFFLNESLYYYRRNPESITQKKDEGKYRKVLVLLNYMIKKNVGIVESGFINQFMYYSVSMVTDLVYDHLRLGEYKNDFKKLMLQYKEVAESDIGKMLENCYLKLNLPFQIRTYMKLIYKRNRCALLKANGLRIVAGGLRRISRR